MSYTGGGTPDAIHVLYINDDGDFAELAQTKLANISSDFDVTTVGTVEAALELLGTSTVDCVVTSYSLPDGTGIDLLNQLQAEQYELPTILFTGRGSERIASEATQAGVSDYIPINAGQNNFELLARRIRTLAEAARKQVVAERLSDRFQRTLERATDAIYAVDDEWQIEYINEKMARRVDRDPDAIVGATIWEEFPSIVGTELEDKYRTAMETGEPVAFEQRLGEPFNYWIEVRAFPDNDGLTVFSRETTVERERELELERSETILENIHDAVFVLNDEGIVEFANAASKRLIAGDQSAQITGQQLETVVGDRISASDAEQFTAAVDATLEDIEGDGGVTGLYDADLQLDITTGGDKRTFDVRVAPFQSNKSRQALVVARDITEQSDVKRQLERERDALRELQTIIARSDASAETRLRELLELGCQTLGLDVGIVSHIQGDAYTVKSVHAPDAEIESGDQFDLESTYCEEVVGTDSVCSFADAVTDGRETHPAYREFELESYIGVPLVVDGDRYGTVNFSSPTTRVAPFGALERTFVELLSELVSAEISRGQDRADLQRQEFLFERVQDIAEIGVWEYFPSTGDLDWSDGVRRIHGVDDEYAPTLDDAVEFYHPDDRETITEAVARALEDREPYDLDLRIVRTDGEVRDVRAWGERVDDTQDDEPVLRGVFQDITERKAEERAHRELAQEYEALLNTSGDAIFMLDVETAGDEPSFEFARLSPGYESQTGLTTDEVRGQTPREVFGDDRGAELAANYTRCVEQREPISYQEELDIADDARFWDTSLAPVTLGDEIVRIVGIARNVTEQVERERELETTNQRLESLIDATPLTVMEIDTDGTVVRWNDGAENMFGWSREEVLGESNPMIPDERQSEFASHRDRALSGKPIRGKEVRRERKDGEKLDLLLSVAPITAPDGEITSVLAVLEDITEQKQLESKLRSLQETAQRLSAAQSSDEIGDIAVEAAVDILGFELTGIWEYADQTDELIPLTASAATRELLDELPRLEAGETLAWEAFEASELRRYDDLQSVTSLDEADTELRRGLFVPLGEFGLIGVGAPQERTFSEADVDLFQILGATVKAAFTRASRETELQRQNERLDEFASVVAHDLRNPLSIAIGFLDIVEETGDLTHLDRIESAHDRMERLIDDLLTLARGETTVTETKQIDLKTMTTEAWGYVDTAEATLTVAETVPTVAGDASRLTQLFENLFRNAIEHGGKDVTVTVGQLEDGDGFYVADDGDGIPPAKRGEVLEHGVTSTKGGTGFGLSIVEDIAKAHGWTVRVTAGAAGGARFEFCY
ncbi:PAS domain S-box protein [Haloarcula sp. CBA1130]|uniref:PAS domain S-box protein n=1 Tax=unclassified Haloarcula TaxID=2624677 RepID=UPI0012487F9C|nr:MULTISPECIES: PAS domain S-box protein [unclassified Haloarcula]KAA9396177.1 PAS domain S-box protein [Haloarcula sp. CBA1129]KAA9400294.1 PAS domain S-box protein [Haloarcula sp. CBA1130]